MFKNLPSFLSGLLFKFNNQQMEWSVCTRTSQTSYLLWEKPLRVFLESPSVNVQRDLNNFKPSRQVQIIEYKHQL